LFVLLFYGLIAGSVLALNVGLSLVPDLLQDHASWNFLFQATRVGKEFLILHLILAGIAAFAWWISREFRLRIPGVLFGGIFLLTLVGWTSSSVFLNSLKE